MRLPIILGALALLVHHPATARAAPAWCRGGDPGNKPSYDVRSMFTEPDANRALLNLIAATCYGDSDLAPYTKQVAALRATWSKRLGLTDADWGEVNDWAHLSMSERGQNKFAVSDRKAAWSAYTPLDQMSALASDIGAVDPSYVADAFGGKLSQLGRLGYVQHCLERASQDDAPVALAMCAADADALDMAKIAAEITADTSHGTADRMTARIVAYETLAQLPKLKQQIATLSAKDPAYAKMFELASATHKAWAGVDAKLVQLAADLDDARVTGSRRASQGCTERAQDAWKTAIEAVGAKRVGQLHAQPGNELGTQLVGLMIAQPAGYLAALALAECATLEGKQDFLTRVIGASLQRWPGHRGPRTGTQTAILMADLKLDDRDARLEFPELKRDWLDGDRNYTTVVGAVGSVKVEGDKAIVTFAKQKVKQTRCTRGHYTSRISQIMSDGTVVYYYQCDAEVTETVEVSPWPPQKVLARYAVELKPGMTAAISDDVVVAAYPKSSTTPSVVTAVRVK